MVVIAEVGTIDRVISEVEIKQWLLGKDHDYKN